MARRGRLPFDLAAKAIGIYQSIAIRFIAVDLTTSLSIASEHRLYAYDAYLLECAKARRAPLLTLDRALARVAAKMTIGTRMSGQEIVKTIRAGRRRLR